MTHRSAVGGERRSPDVRSSRLASPTALLGVTLIAACARAPRASSAPAAGRSGATIVAPDVLDRAGPKAEIMMVGTFHFARPGRDAYQEQFPVDVMTPERQREIEDVVERLARFRPTRIAVEQMPMQQPRLDSLYRAYLAGTYSLGVNEVTQLGFRLAKRMGLPRVVAIDAREREYEPGMTEALYDSKVRALGQRDSLHTVWDDRYARLYRFDDSLKAVVPLATYLAYLSSPARVALGHGSYLVGKFKLGRGDDYLGPDMATTWYNRNLRIFANLQRATESPRERILLIIGSGHLPLLRFFASSSPEYRLVEATPLLEGR